MIRALRISAAACSTDRFLLTDNPSAWVCFVVSPGESRERQTRSPRHAGELLRWLEEDDWVVVLSPADRRAGLRSLRWLVDLFAGGRSTFVALPGRRKPPARDYRDDGAVSSFACSAPLFRATARDPRRPSRWCYLVLGEVLAAATVERLLVRQIPMTSEAPVALPPPDKGEPVVVLLPHRGRPHLLGAALHFLSVAWGRPRTLVGLDTGAVAGYRRLAARYPSMKFFRSEPAPLGPYVLRDALARRAREELLLFQDSDDASCWDRLLVLEQAMVRTRCSFVGSHELRLDEIGECVRAVRFPLDVSGALRVRPHHPLLLPTALLRRQSYLEAGGFSTDLAFALDTQFVLRAYFSMRIRNADEFLYVRRQRRGSLTSSPKTGLGTPARLRLLLSWARDFFALQAGELALERSSLSARLRQTPYRLIPLDRA